MSRSAIWRWIGVIVSLAIAVFAYVFLHTSSRARERVYKVLRPRERQPTVPAAATVEAETPPQLPKDGVGPLFHRRYYIDIERANRTPEQVMDEIKRNLNAFSPSLYASFEKTQGDAQGMEQGDEYHIRMAGPWDGSVCVAQTDPLSFSLVTLDGHPEAGIIRFRFVPHPTNPGLIRFEIASWARSRDTLVDWTYTGLKIAQRVQTNMWVTFCERVAKATGGTAVGEIAVITEEQPESQLDSTSAKSANAGSADAKAAKKGAGDDVPGAV